MAAPVYLLKLKKMTRWPFSREANEFIITIIRFIGVRRSYNFPSERKCIPGGTRTDWSDLIELIWNNIVLPEVSSRLPKWRTNDRLEIKALFMFSISGMYTFLLGWENYDSFKFINCSFFNQSCINDPQIHINVLQWDNFFLILKFANIQYTTRFK